MPGMRDMYEAGPEEAEPEQREEGRDEKEQGKTFVANSEAFPDCEPGHVYMCRAVKIHGDEIEFVNEGMKEGDEHEEAKSEPEPEMAGAPGMYD